MNKEKVIEILKDYAYFEDDDYGGNFTYIDFSQKALIPLGILEILNYIEDLQQKAELEEHYKHLYSKVKKQKDDVVELIKARIKENEGHVNARIEIYHYKNMLRMLGEIVE